jgi:hypothetical protein
MWFVVENGLHVPLTQRTWKWANGLFKRKSSDTVQSEFGTNTPDASTTAANVRKCEDEKQPENVVVKPCIDQSKPEHRSKKHKARNRKWSVKRETQKQDEENGIENEK